MLTNALDRYRACDPVDRAAADPELTDVMIRRRLADVGFGNAPSASGAGGRSIPRSRRWPFLASCAVVLGVVALIGLVLAQGTFGHDRSSVKPSTSMSTESGGVEIASAVGAPVGNLPAPLERLALDALADRVAEAVNQASTDDVLALLSPQSECDWPLSSSRTASTCEEFWAHQLAIGSEIAFRNCTGTIPQRCTVTMAPPATLADGRRDRTRDLRVELGIEGDRLVIRRAPAPTRGSRRPAVAVRA